MSTPPIFLRQLERIRIGCAGALPSDHCNAVRLPPAPRHRSCASIYRIYRRIDCNVFGTRGMNRAVLIVDDDRSCRLSLHRLLHTVGYPVAIAENGADALRIAPQVLPAVVLMDLQLSDANGFDVARMLRKDPSLATMRMIALSGTPAIGPDRTLFHRTLMKPCRACDLIGAIEATLR